MSTEKEIVEIKSESTQRPAVSADTEVVKGKFKPSTKPTVSTDPPDLSKLPQFSSATRQITIDYRKQIHGYISSALSPLTEVLMLFYRWDIKQPNLSCVFSACFRRLTSLPVPLPHQRPMAQVQQSPGLR